MATTGAVSSATGTFTGNAEGKQVGQLGKEDFLKLLVAQLRNQDPMKPMDDSQFLGQMAQFSSLERMQALDDQMGVLLRVEQLGQANGMIGKEVEAAGGADGKTIKGTVDSVKIQDGDALLSIGGQSVKLQDVLSVVDSEKVQLAQASSLIGKLVEAKLAATGETVQGIVDSVKMLDGSAVLVIGGKSVKLSEVVSVAGSGI